MATITEQLKFLVTADASSAIKAFEKTGDAADKNLKKAESASSKIGGSLTKFGAGAMAFAGTAAIAIAGTVKSFEDLAISAGKFGDATGTTVEDASRLMEVVGDLGIESGTAEKALGFMNKTLGKSPQLFHDLNVEVATTKDGATDVVGTFGNVIDHLNGIKDPAQRAIEGTQLLGKNWMEMAELIKGGSTTLKQSMAEVSDAQVINDDELAKAKALRDAMDRAGDAVKGLALNIGAGAAPVVTTLANALGGVVEVVGKLDAISGGAVGKFAAMGTAALGIVGALSFVSGQIIKMRDRFTDVGADGVRSLTGLGKAASTASVAIGVMGATLAGLQILDTITSNADDAGDALNAFVVQSGKLKGATNNTTDLLNAWQQMSERVDQSQGLFSRTLGDLSHAFDQSGENLEHLKKGFDKIFAQSPQQAEALVEALEKTADAAAHGDAAAQHWLDKNSLSTGVIKGFREQVDNAAGAMDVLTSEQEDNTSATDDNAAATKAAEDATKAHEDAVNRAADALRKEAQALNDQASAMRATADANYAVADATDAYNTYLGTLAQSVADAKGDQAAINALYRDGTQLAADHADAVVRVATETANANGQTLSAVDAQDAWNREMLYSATQASPQLRDEILNYIATANGIPPEKLTDIRALIDDGKFDEADALLAELSAARTVDVTAIAHTAQANQDLINLTTAKTVDITAKVTGALGKFGINVGGNAAGTESATPGPSWVGEHGPELMWMRGGERIASAPESSRITAAGPNVSQSRGPLVHMENVVINSGTDAAAVASAINLKLIGV